MIKKGLTKVSVGAPAASAPAKDDKKKEEPKKAEKKEEPKKKEPEPAPAEEEDFGMDLFGWYAHCQYSYQQNITLLYQ